MPLQTEVPAAHDLARHQEPLAVQAACPALLALRALHLLLVDYSVKAAAAAAVALLALAVLAVMEVAAPVVAAAAQHAVRTPLALVA